MALKRRQIAIILSVIYLGALTILAAYAAHAANSYGLPIPNSLSSLALALPPIAGITIETSNALATALSTNPKHRRAAQSTIPPILLPGTITIALLLIYETVIATLASTKIAPIAALTCGLQDKWVQMFHEKNEKQIRIIQDAFQCCGLRNSRDMAWPFPSRTHGADACHERYGRERDVGCLAGWRAEERKVGGIMLAVAIGVFIWMVVVIVVPVAQPKPLRRMLQLPAPNGDGEGQEQGRLEHERYTDDPDGENSDEDNVTTRMRREIDMLNSQSNLASLVEGNRNRPSMYSEDSHRWREP